MAFHLNMHHINHSKAREQVTLSQWLDVADTDFCCPTVHQDSSSSAASSFLLQQNYHNLLHWCHFEMLQHTDARTAPRTT
eukprot:6481647-Amphidinium_carterae.3